MSSHETDDKAIDELRAMARIYRNHGFKEKADQLTELADAMMLRAIRARRHEEAGGQGHDVVHNQDVAQMDDYREEA
jgi:hypothetical protein